MRGWFSKRPIATITTIEGKRHYTPRPGQSPAEYAAEKDAMITAAPAANSPKNAPRLDGLITQPQPESHPRWQTVGRKKKSAPIFYAGRCPVCRCSRLHRDEGWAEASLLGWTVGVCWR